jgi:hypothetical protein
MELGLPGQISGERRRMEQLLDERSPEECLTLVVERKSTHGEHSNLIESSKEQSGIQPLCQSSTYAMTITANQT